MKKIFAIILVITLLTLSACADNSSVSDAESKVESSYSDTNGVSSKVDEQSTESEPSEASEQINLTSEVSEVKMLDEISVEHGVYSFYENGRGEYFTEFDTVENEENGGLTLLLKDGRSVDLIYGDIVYDEQDKIHKTTINGLLFWVEDVTDGEGRMLQILECIERPQRSIFVHYYPELDCGDMTICFDYEANGTEYTFKYADGNTAVKTILYDEERGEYYFG